MAAPRPFSGGDWLDPAPDPEIDWSNANVVIDGDSLTAAGYNEAEYSIDAWPFALDVLLPSGATVSNMAHPDSTLWVQGNVFTDLMGATRLSAFDGELSGTRVNIAILFAGTNDCVDGAAQAGATTASRIATWTSGRRTAGFDHVFIMNCCWRIDLSTGAAATRRTDLNAALASGVGADGVIDISSAIGTEPTHGANFLSDDIHFTQHAHTNVLAPTVRDALYAALGAP